ncbi:MAG: hypothetical protein GY856_55775 [bacterium]|nr:hypothetical protein [bacterium]
MKPQNKTVTALVTTVVLAAVGFGLYLLFQAFTFLAGSLEVSEISSTALIACATLLLSSMILARGLSRRPSPPNPEAPAKEALYERVLSAWSEGFRQGRPPGGAELDELERLLVLRASKRLLDGYLELKKLEGPFESSDPALRSALERLVAEIRKDLGHRELPWTSASAVDLLLRRSEPPARAVPGSHEFKVVREE